MIKWASKSVIDLYVNDDGIIFSADVNGYIDVTAADGSLIFEFGSGWTNEDISGLYSSLCSIAVSSDGELWGLDNDKAFLQSYKPTEYALSIYNALTSFNKGFYEEAGLVWEDVLRHNQMSSLAHYGLGQSYLYQRDYQQAEEHFELSGNRFYYSQSYWETRNEWLLSNLYWILGAVISLAVIAFLLKHIDKKRIVKRAVSTAIHKVTDSPKIKNIAFAGTVARHPLDSYYYLKRKEKGSVSSAVIYFVFFFISFMIYTTSKGFILQYTAIEDLDMPVILTGFFGIIFLFIICNYLVTSINDGEGTIKEIFMVFSYSAFPLSVSLIAITLLSHIITLNEAFLLDIIMLVSVIWSVVLLYLGLQEIHGYNVKNNVKSLLITFAFILIVVVILFNLTILGEQFYDFIEGIIREVIGNVQNIY